MKPRNTASARTENKRGRTVNPLIPQNPRALRVQRIQKIQRASPELIKATKAMATSNLRKETLHRVIPTTEGSPMKVKWKETGRKTTATPPIRVIQKTRILKTRISKMAMPVNRNLPNKKARTIPKTTTTRTNPATKTSQIIPWGNKGLPINLTTLTTRRKTKPLTTSNKAKHPSLHFKCRRYHLSESLARYSKFCFGLSLASL